MNSSSFFPALLKPVVISLCAAFAMATLAPAVEAKQTSEHTTKKQAPSKKQAPAKKAAPAKKRNSGKAPVARPRPHAAPSSIGTSVVIDASNGNVITFNGTALCNGCDIPRPPASMTKLVTAMVAFDAINRGQLQADTMLPLEASPEEDANAAVGLHRKYGFPVGGRLSVDTLLYATAITSAADATITLSNAICGTDNCIATLMNQKLDTIFAGGRHVTNYANAHGMPDPRQVTTAREQALILKYMVDQYPQQFRHFFGQSGYRIGNRYMKGHNRLLVDYNTRSKFNPYSCQMEGGKTGYFRAAGSNIAGSAVCGGHRVIAVKMGASSAPARDSEMVRLFDAGLNALKDTPSTIPNSAHKPGILRSTPELEPEPDNVNPVPGRATIPQTWKPALRPAH